VLLREKYLLLLLINYPKSAILGIGKIHKRPIVNDNDEIIICPMMYLCLSHGHRIINGKTAAQFNGKIIKNLEERNFLKRMVYYYEN
jgi:pyruvate/2-oxoglutarate dehydrogenase complex dihydrolipoamide acyltransferase (E2) component